MSANFTDINRKLTIVLENGVNANGEPKTKSRTYSGLSETASADNILAAGQALASFMDAPVVNIYVKDTNEVVEA